MPIAPSTCRSDPNFAKIKPLILDSNNARSPQVLKRLSIAKIISSSDFARGRLPE